MTEALTNSAQTFRSATRVKVPVVAVACLVSAFAAAMAFWATAGSPMNPLAFALAFGVVAFLGMLPLAVEFHGNIYDLVSPVTVLSLSYAFLFTFGSIFQASGSVPLDRAGVLADFPKALFYAGLGLAGFQLGYYLVPWRKVTPVAQLEKLNLPRVVFTFVLLVGVTWLIRIYLATLGVGSARLGFQTGVLSTLGSTAKIVTDLLSYAIIPMGLYVLKASRGTRFAQPLYRLFFAGGILGEFLFWLLADWRSRFLIDLGILIVVTALLSGRLRLWRWVLLGVGGFLLFLPVLANLRVNTVSTASTRTNQNNPLVFVARSAPMAVSGTLVSYTDSVSRVATDLKSRLTALDFFVEVIPAADNNGYMHGKTVTKSLPSLVPRFLWHNKPDLQGAKVQVILQYRLVRRDTMITPPTELYANFGVTGVLAGMIFLGVFIRGVFQLSLLRYGPTLRGLLLYAPLIGMLVAFQEQGGIFNMTLDFLRTWGVFWVLTFIAYGLLSSRRGTGASVSDSVMGIAKAGTTAWSGAVGRSEGH